MSWGLGYQSEPSWFFLSILELQAASLLLSLQGKLEKKLILLKCILQSTCKQNLDTTNNILWSCNEKGKVITSHNNRNDGRKTQQRETTREDDRWTCQVAGSRQGGWNPESNKGSWNMEGHDRQHYKAWHRMMMILQSNNKCHVYVFKSSSKLYHKG